MALLPILNKKSNLSNLVQPRPNDEAASLLGLSNLSNYLRFLFALQKHSTPTKSYISKAIYIEMVGQVGQVGQTYIQQGFQTVQPRPTCPTYE